MKQYTESQYDDDLTVGTDDYDDSYYTGSVDLFEFANDEESPISRLKSLILSIDWEITDEILMQFNEELVDLRDIWAGEKINLVYVQALEKISKYIYQKKADSHPSAIKLLLTLYHNLEKIVSSNTLTEAEKKEILFQDVKRFDSLKRHIGQKSETVAEIKTVKPIPKKQTKNIGAVNQLMHLKAIVLSIDWEITDEDLNALRKEVVRLEKEFTDSRTRLILLQGIGTLCAYIKLKKSNAHADAFKILHLFYESLEKIVVSPRTLEEEKAILFPAVEQFNSFKLMLGSTIEAEAIKRDEKHTDGTDNPVDVHSIAPAFADLPEEEVKGFQAEEEAEALGIENSGNIHNHIESFFTGSSFQVSEAPIHADNNPANDKLRERTIPGLDVELDDEEEENRPISESAELAPALRFAVNDRDEVEPALAFAEEDSGLDDEEAVPTESFGLPTDEILPDPSVNVNFVDPEEEKSGLDFNELDRDIVLQGVEVETEADDDSDEEALPMMGGELAPALAENDEISIYNSEILEKTSIEENIEEEIAGTLGGFFDEEIESHLSAAPEGETRASVEVPTAVAAANDASGRPETTTDDEDDDIAFFAESHQGEVEEDVFAVDGDFAPVDEDGQREDFTEIDEHLDTFFALEEGGDELAEDDMLSFALPHESAEDNDRIGEDAAPSVPDEFEEEVVFELVAEDDVVFSTLPPDGENVSEFPGKFVSIAESDTVSAVYQSLHTCVASLGFEMNDQVIGGLWREIDHLYQDLSDRPLEKTFLQLLSTVTRHIDQNRFEASGDAYDLLKSVCRALTDLPESDLLQKQEMLLTETHKVLKWQEDLLAWQLAKK